MLFQLVAIPFDSPPIESGDYLLAILPGVTIFALSAAIAIAILYGLRWYLHLRTRHIAGMHHVVLLVRVPKESQRGEEKPKEERTELIREMIGKMEALFSNIGGLHCQSGLGPFFFGRTDHMAFEIVAHNGLISFYVTVSPHAARFIEQQIHAQFPEAQIEPVTDYNIFSARGSIRAAYLKQRKSVIFPIKTYQETEADPINALTNTLSKLAADEGAVIQYIVRPASSHWRVQSLKLRREIQRGKSVEEALHSIDHPLLRFLNGLVTGMGNLTSEAFSTKKGKEESRQKEKENYKLSQFEEEMLKGIEKKASKAGLEVNVRLVASASLDERAHLLLENLVSAFNQYNIYEYGNAFGPIIPRTGRGIRDFIFRSFADGVAITINAEELASLFHFPLQFTETPNIQWLRSKRAPAPPNMPTEGIRLGFNIYRGVETIVKMKREDRRRHMYVVGMTGSGKSNLMTSLAVQDIKNGEGVGVIDPHGSLVEDILENIPPERADDVILFEPSDVERPVGLNMLEADTPEEADFAVQEMIAIFYKLVTDPSMIGPMFEHQMRNAMLTLMADKKSLGTLADIPRIFTDSEFQKYKLANVTDPMVRAFWEKEMAKTTDFHKSEMLGYLISKVGRFVENAMIRNIIGQGASGFNIKEVMEKKKILLVNLAKGKVGEMNANLLGLILVSKLQMAALARDTSNPNLPDFYLYIDEFQNFITDSIATILAEARKYRLCLIMAHQYIGQLGGGGVEGKQESNKVKDAIFGNVGTLATFRIGPDDAEFLEKQYAPVFNQFDLINIDRFNAYIRLLIDNTASRPFNMETDPAPKGDKAVASAIRQLSRLKYGKDRALIEADILARTKLGAIPTSEATVERTL